MGTESVEAVYKTEEVKEYVQNVLSFSVFRVYGEPFGGCMIQGLEKSAKLLRERGLKSSQRMSEYTYETLNCQGTLHLPIVATMAEVESHSSQNVLGIDDAEEKTRMLKEVRSGWC
ncbi:hypothetical protein C5167_004179 [Papaver somniferum]|nr:hypothetical protein C5167_004179 [Papaver somniferum]